MILNKEEFFENYIKEFEIPIKFNEILWWFEETNLRSFIISQLEANHQYFKITNESSIFEITNFLFECYEKQLKITKFENENLKREYEVIKEKLIENIKNKESQLSLSIKFKNFKKIIELYKNDKEKLKEYIELFKKDNFFSILFQQFKKNGK